MSTKTLALWLSLAAQAASGAAAAQDAAPSPAAADLGSVFGRSIDADTARGAAAPLQQVPGTATAPGKLGPPEAAASPLPRDASPRDLTESIGLDAVHDFLTPTVTRRGGAF
ncbi:hypothetical protein [Caenispirillum bisanense]|uniref:Uncharacterized protein n=1 Tax=Caenispirillum bisanense TaxID=414052 RepID=A0A286GWP7_9PROT|nr:hypothetical protein [Caenispirillum bisanense]SOD99509.1 hypothetical protein SAMN05421508_10938 [Caenispirillum bisanense]